MSLAPASDRQEIIDVTIAYCWALDTRDWAALSDVFTPDATAGLGGTQAGLDQIIDRVSSALRPFPATQHIVTNHAISIDDSALRESSAIREGSTATSRCYVQAVHVWESGELYTIGGRYEDRFVRSADGWRISHRDLIVQWTNPVRKQTTGS